MVQCKELLLALTSCLPQKRSNKGFVDGKLRVREGNNIVLLDEASWGAVLVLPA